jgi:tetratricopeptide (TPR) repeat protein
LGTTERKRSRRLQAALCLLAILAAVGLVRLLHSRGYREYRLRRMSEPELHAWTAKQPGEALGHYHLALACDRSGREDEAAREYGKALDLDPWLTAARPPLAALLVARGQRRAAEILLQQGAQLDPAAPALHAGLARFDEARGDFRSAASEWDLAVSLAPQDAAAWFHLGRCWMDLDVESRALPPFQRAVRLAPLSAECQEALAGALRLRGRYAEAGRHCRRALFLRPDDPQAHFELAKLLRDRDGATPQAEQSLRHAVSLQPDNPVLRYYTGTICLERGELSAAAAEYQAALRLLHAQEPPATSAGWPERTVWLSYLEGAHFNLARALQRLGRATEAAGHLAQFRRISDYHLRVNQLLVRAATRPDDASLRFELARVHAAAGFWRLADEQYRAGLRLRAALPVME